MNVGTMLLPGPKVILPLELELFANTLSTVAELALRKRLRSACVAFDWRSSTASMRAAKTRAPRTPVASHAVSRLKLLITSPVNGHFLVLGSLARGRGFCTQEVPLENGSGHISSFWSYRHQLRRNAVYW